jgi:hypothetical protein
VESINNFEAPNFFMPATAGKAMMRTALRQHRAARMSYIQGLKKSGMSNARLAELVSETRKARKPALKYLKKP